jgi:CHAD domain-containing protein
MTTPKTEALKPESSQPLLEALENRWRNYRVELKRCRDEFSNEAVHDLRVATRRILAFIRLLDSISPRPRLKKLTRTFKDQLDEFDELRDTQVILAELSEILLELPQLRDFQKSLQSSEERMLRALRKRLKKLEITETAKRVRKTRESIASKKDGGLESQIMQAVDEAFQRVKQRHSEVAVDRPATIHRVRVAFKSFRYMVEIAHPLMLNFPTENLKRMNDYQTLMGEIQDAEVFAQTLADFTEHASLSNPEPVRHYVERRHADAISVYVAEKNPLDIFWRSAPEQPFHWEKTE